MRLCTDVSIPLGSFGTVPSGTWSILSLCRTPKVCLWPNRNGLQIPCLRQFLWLHVSSWGCQEVPVFKIMGTLWLCQNSYWKWPFSSLMFPLKMVIFHSYVGLPEGNLQWYTMIPYVYIFLCIYFYMFLIFGSKIHSPTIFGAILCNRITVSWTWSLDGLHPAMPNWGHSAVPGLESLENPPAVWWAYQTSWIPMWVCLKIGYIPNYSHLMPFNMDNDH